MKDFPDETRAFLQAAIQETIADQLDVEIGTLKARIILDELKKSLGQAAYNQGISDAQTYLQTRLLDMEIELAEELKK